VSRVHVVCNLEKGDVMAECDPVQSCIYCGSDEISQEHVFPAWLRKLFPEEPPGVRFVAHHTVYGRGLPELTVEPQVVKGRLMTSLKEPIVCHACNNGWMSRLQTAAAGPLSDMIAGRPVNLSPVDQATLIKWALMTFITAEFTARDARRIGIPVADRQALRAGWELERRPVFDGWDILIGKHRGSLSEEIWYDHTFNTEVNRPLGVSNTLVLGQLVVQGWRWIAPGRDRILSVQRVAEQGAVILKCPADGDLSWPAANDVDDIGVARFQCYLKMWFEQEQFVRDSNAQPIPRLSPCRCGSGVRYKDCHGRLLS
jgi:hypothetical protein